MKRFTYSRPGSVDEALSLLGAESGARLIGGGTNLVDLMREGVESPSSLVDVAELGLDGITTTADGFLVGAAVGNTTLATDPRIRTTLPFVAAAIVSGASGQIRNMATVGGNVMQRTRCSYFYDRTAVCNKRDPGAGCAARDGFARNTAIIGASPACVSVHPSDLCVPLVALDAVVHLRGLTGARSVPLAQFHLEPGDAPQRETVLGDGELIEAVEIPRLPAPGYRTAYRKVRDRASYAFALVSVGAALKVDDGVVTDVRLALGGIGTRPWRARAAEQALRGGPATDDAFAAAISAELAPAQPLADARFKVGLAERTVVAVLRDLRDSRDENGGTGR